MGKDNTQLATGTKPGKLVKRAGVEIMIPDVSVEQEAAKRATERYGDLVIDCQEVYVYADNELTKVKTRLKNTKALVTRLQSRLEQIRKDAVAGKGEIANEFTIITSYDEKAEQLLKAKMVKYIDDQERIRAEEERKLRQQQAAEERRRMEEAQRQAREESERVAAEARRLQAKADEVAKDDEARAAALRAEAEEVVMQGHETVENIMFIAEVQSDVEAIVPSSRPKMAGTAVKRPYIPTVTSIKELCRGVWEGKIPVEVIEVKMAWFRTEATRLGPNFNYPGVESKQETQIAKTV